MSQDSSTPKSQRIGIYEPQSTLTTSQRSRPDDHNDDNVESSEQPYRRVALYNLDTESWAPTSDGRIIRQTSKNPSLNELLVRFYIESRHTTVLSLEEIEDANIDTTIRDPEIPLEQGLKDRKKPAYPPVTVAEQQFYRQEGYIVVPDGTDTTETNTQFYNDQELELIHRSDAPKFDFTQAV